MVFTLCKVGAAVLLMAAMVGGQDSSPPESILRFQLTETPESVLRTLGGGASIVHLKGLDLYEFRRADEDSEEEPDWRFTFQLPNKRLVVVTRNYESPIDVMRLFPGNESELKLYPDKEKPTLSLLVRKLDSRRLLLAPARKRKPEHGGPTGVGKAGSSHPHVPASRQAAHESAHSMRRFLRMC